MKSLNEFTDKVLARILDRGTAAADFCEDVTERQNRACSNGCYQPCSRQCRICVLAGKSCGAWSCSGCNLCP